MTTFRPRILQCPYCKTSMYSFELTSYTVHNPIVYSDGKIENSHSSLSDKQILICNDCRKPMWRNDVLLEDSDINYETLPEAKDIFDLPFAFDSDFSNKLAQYYSNLLNSGFADTSEKEIYLCIKIWHLLNNSSRSNASLKANNAKQNAYNLLFIDNLRHLIKIYTPDCDEEQLLYAEMFRELGDFDEAKLQLNKIKHIDNNHAYNTIAELINNKKSNVVKII